MAADKTQEDPHSDPQTYRIIGAAIEVHRVLGNGFLEAVYQEALATEFADRKIPYLRECGLSISYKARTLQCQYRADFIAYENIIIEVKAMDRITTRDDAQVLNYLKATGVERALLLNFGQTRLQHRRLIRSHARH